MDKVENELDVKLFKRDNERVYISAINNKDLESLKDKIVSIIKADYEKIAMHIPFKDSDVLDYMMTNYDILERRYDEDGSNIVFEISKEDKAKYERFITKV